MSVMRGQQLKILPYQQGGTTRQHHVDLPGHWVWGPLLLPLPWSSFPLPPTEFTEKDMILFIDLFSGLSVVLHPGIDRPPNMALSPAVEAPEYWCFTYITFMSLENKEELKL